MENKIDKKGLFIVIILFVSIFLLIFIPFNFYRVNDIEKQDYVRLYSGGEKGREKYLRLEPSCLVAVTEKLRDAPVERLTDAGDTLMLTIGDVTARIVTVEEPDTLPS